MEGECDLRFFENQTSIFSRVHATLYVTMLVRRLVGPSVITSRFWLFRAKGRADFSYILPLPSYHTAPAHPHATDAAVYTALLKNKELRTPT